MVKKKRVFIAVALPVQVQQELARIIALLKKEHLCEGNYVNPYIAHVTIQFIGLVPEDIIAVIHAALQTITFPTFTISLDSLGFFTKKERIAIIYANIKSDELQMLATQVKHAVAPWLELNQEQQFVGHITLLRVKKIYDEPALRTFLTATQIEPIPWKIHLFLLMESTLTPEGPRYIPLYEYRLVT